MSELSTLQRFGIYHPKDGKLNITCDIAIPFEYVTSIQAENLVRSVYLSMDIFNPNYKALGKRNTTVGDLITNGSKLYMVKHNGFKKIPTTKPLYKDIMQTDEAIIEILSRKHLSQDDIDELIDNCF
jgi:hypothetical protein